jgi:hypothetical protein
MLLRQLAGGRVKVHEVLEVQETNKQTKQLSARSQKSYLMIFPTLYQTYNCLIHT